MYLGPDLIAVPIRARERLRHASVVNPAANGDAGATLPADTHWSRILCYDLEAGRDGWPRETSMLPTEPDPRHRGTARRAKRLAAAAIVLGATFVALYAAAGAFFRASTLPNAAATVAPASVVVQPPPSVSDFPVDVRARERQRLVLASDERDAARHCAPAASIA